MHYLAFDKNWFSKHQKKLLWLLKFRIFRKILRIDCDERILEITPNSYTIHVSGNKFKTDFRTYWKYSKRLYYAFRPLWWAMHIWDLCVDNTLPFLSFGFSTLTAYPDADPETTTVDGFTVGGDGTNTTWATVRSATGNAFSDASQFMVLAGWLTGTASNTYQNIYRYICLFDTSSLTSSASISSAILSVFGRGKEDGGSNANVIFNVYSSNPASNTGLANGDFSTLGSTSYATDVTYASFDGTNTVYTDFTLNSTGIAAVSKTSISKFGVREKTYDVGNVAPTWVNGNFTRALIFGAEETSGSKDPKLVVTYTLASPNHFLSLLGVGT